MVLAPYLLRKKTNAVGASRNNTASNHLAVAATP